MNKQTIQLFGCPIDVMDLNQTSSYILSRVGLGQGGYQVSINSLKLREYCKSIEMRDVIDGAAMRSADGASAVLGVRLTLGLKIPRVTGIDLAESVMEKCQNRDIGIFLLGATPEVLSSARINLTKHYPRLRILGSNHGFWQNTEEGLIIQSVQSARAQLCLVALPSPFKESFIHRTSKSLPNVFFIPVGGAFDIWAGITKRSPKWIQLLGFEWLFRLVQDPRKLLKRYLVSNSFYLYKLIMNIIKR